MHDMQLLAALGYKQELRRHYSTVQGFAIAFSIIGLLPSIASTLLYSIPAGHVGNGLTLALGWFAASAQIFKVALTMADLASAMPTAGGLYFWTHYFSGEKWKNPLSFVIGYSLVAIFFARMMPKTQSVCIFPQRGPSFGHCSRSTHWESSSRGAVELEYLQYVFGLTA
ncbi:uncharacterized protein BP01DRAFT_385908 [Aspergillus saccharolyticus JOP 1030-1]|uniref:Amino acid permease/ SLC12A domain-containing protein n=1 Tax=Aspergillus saccharolyticus JOP 1030-1 TaxID=1450539 RepID=A0A319A3N2_9EURO|nr:hypothetical protein BP01DRAFT_385908 [Aspergillus saccharolyticus JOP 1030-1]PYH42062.1 hypothetical protein BP01DRAFT_385908 [Aspergillus saccharolyticus JOP 1030-1]